MAIQTIKKGKHRPRWWWLKIRPHFGIREMARTVVFDESCHYGWKAKPELDAWNKLFGWSNWNSKNSIRIGWRPALDGSKRVQLGAYVKQGGKRTTQMPAMDLGAWDYGELLTIKMWRYTNSEVQILITDKEHYTLRTGDFQRIRFGWLMGLYFGGSATAPHDMAMTIT